MWRRPAFLIIVSLALGGPAAAQLAPSSSAPVDVTADQLDVQRDQCLASWRGHAEALQGTSRLRADTLNIYQKVEPAKAGAASGGASGAASGNCGELERFEADGQVYYVTPSEVVKGDHAVYLADAKTITVTGDVVATQGKNVVVGDRLVINTDTGQATMESGAKGAGAAGRVRGVFYTNSNQTGGGLFPSSKSRP